MKQFTFSKKGISFYFWAHMWTIYFLYKTGGKEFKERIFKTLRTKMQIEEKGQIDREWCAKNLTSEIHAEFVRRI